MSLGRAEKVDGVPQIPVTHSWGDVFANAPVTVESKDAIFPGAKPGALADPVQVSAWLGVDRDQASSNGAVVVYAVCKGVNFPSGMDTELGPFQIVVHSSKKPNR